MTRSTCSTIKTLATAGLVALFVLNAGNAFGATFDVTRMDDPAPNGCAVGDCSLREAILAANAAGGADIINLPTGTYLLTIPGNGPAAYLAGIPLGELLRAEQRGTAVALARAGRPSLCWELPAVNSSALGQLLVALETQTAAQATLYGIDAYDQPGVEAGKVAAFALLGREGYGDERAAILRDAPPSWRV